MLLVELDRTDRDWTFHISYLIEAISKRHKGFGRRAHSMLQQMEGRTPRVPALRLTSSRRCISA